MSNFELFETIRGTRTSYRMFIVQNTKNKTYVPVSDITFNNCQIFTIGSFANLLYAKGFLPENITAGIKEIRDLCGIGKRLCQVDIHQTIFEKIKPHIKVHSKKAYTNLTTSKMVSLIIDLR